MRRLALTIAIACAATALLCSCAMAPPLAAPAPLSLGPGSWRVMAAPGPLDNARMAALREAAALTLSQGGDWFRVVERAPTSREYRDQDLMTDFHSPVDETASLRTLDIVVGHGAKPDDMDVYDAHEVSKRLGPAQAPPPARGSAAPV